jgi:hypothetical protein
MSELALGGSSNYTKTPFCSLWGSNFSVEQIYPQFLFWTSFLDNSIIPALLIHNILNEQLEHFIFGLI